MAHHLNHHGEIGIRKRFKISRPVGHLGSTPSGGTIYTLLYQRVGFLLSDYAEIK